jgi:histidinol-phosphate aminotransferase
MNIEQVKSMIRPNILQLVPYSSARSEFKEKSDIFLDANENPFNNNFNRYPDPLQLKLKDKIAEWRRMQKNHLVLGNGSDEIIDLIIRIFCKPGKDSIVTFDPSYGMYKVCADINDIKVRSFGLDENFKFKKTDLYRFFKKSDKILFICTPNNPTGNSISFEDIISISKKFEGIIVVDEAYIDFSRKPSTLSILDQIPQLIVLQTLSKAVGCAGLRIGLGWMHPELAVLFNYVKPPYNISTLSQDEALKRLSDFKKIDDEIKSIIEQRSFLKKHLLDYRYVLKVYPSDANFLLVKCRNADRLYHYFIQNGIVVRNRSNQYGCGQCLRITVGTPEENQKLIDLLPDFNFR